VFACWPGLEANQRAVLIAAGIPTFASAQQLWRSMNSFTEWQTRRANGVPADPLDPPAAPLPAAAAVSYRTARELAGEAGLRQPRYVVIGPGEPVGRVIGPRLAAPVAAKLSLASVVHKADAGGVRLGITADAELAQFTHDVRAGHGPGAEVIVEEMIGAGAEVLVSARRTEFGVLLTLGWGGALAEAIGDVAELMLPASSDRILAAARTTKVWRTLARGAALPLDAAETAVMSIVRAVLDCLAAAPDVALVEVNPVIVNQDGASAADVRILRFAAVGEPGSAAQTQDRLRIDA
jgi:hypothetical protein